VQAAEPPVKVEGLRVGLGERNQFKVGAWAPLRIQLKGGREGFAGFMDVVAPDDDGTPTVFRRAVSLNPDTTEWVSSYVRLGSMNSDIHIQMRDERGHAVGREISTESLPQQVDSLPADKIVIGTLGHAQGVDTIPALSGFATNDQAGRGDSFVQVIPLRVPDGIPARWYGYDALEALVIDTNDKDVMAALDAGRGEALQAWVRSGGHLVIAVGGNWQQVNDSVLEPMLPARPSGRVQLDDPSTLEQFAGSTKPVTRGTHTVTITRLEVNESRGGIAQDSTPTPLVVRGPYGFGRVTMLAMDVDQKPFSDWEDRGLFWTKALDLHRNTEEGASASAPAPGSRAIMQGNVTDLSTLLHSALEQFGGVKLVPFGWVAFFIFLYILLIGPGDYLFLKKVLKRMELTWVTFPLIVLTVSLLAYYAAYAVKGTELRINKVDAIDLDQQTGQLRGTTWVTLFSPQNRDYDLSLEPQSLTEAKGRGNAADVMLTWFGVPEAGFNGMNSSGRLGLSGSAYSYGPTSPQQAPDKPESLKQVRVPIWSTKSFIGRWSGQSGPVLESNLEMVGTDRLAGTVTNLLKKPLHNVNIFFGKQVYYGLGTLGPGETVRVELKETRTVVGFLEDQNRSLPNEPWNMQKAQLPRADLVRTLMFHDGGGARATVLSSHPLHYLDLTGQLALNRPMLVAMIEGPGAALSLGDEPQKPKLEQTTVLRVILPLGKAKPDATPDAAAEAKDEK
jgi:hypothetical protein